MLSTMSAFQRFRADGRLRTAAVACLAVAALAGCDRRVAQCNELIEVINAQQAALQSIDPEDGEALRRLAGALDTTAQAVGGVELESDQLRDYRDEYRSMCEGVSRAATTVAQHLSAGEKERADDAAVALRAMRGGEEKLVNSINGYCQNAE